MDWFLVLLRQFFKRSPNSKTLAIMGILFFLQATIIHLASYEILTPYHILKMGLVYRNFEFPVYLLKFSGIKFIKNKCYNID